MEEMEHANKNWESISALYAGGWKSGDKEALQAEYGFDGDEVGELCKDLAEIEFFDLQKSSPETSLLAIFDTGGGVTLALGGYDALLMGGYVHHYCRTSQAAEDCYKYLMGEDTEEWEGDESHYVESINKMVYDAQTGGSRVYSKDEILAETREEDSSGDSTVDRFCWNLKKNIREGRE